MFSTAAALAKWVKPQVSSSAAEEQKTDGGEMRAPSAPSNPAQARHAPSGCRGSRPQGRKVGRTGELGVVQLPVTLHARDESRTGAGSSLVAR